MLGAFYGRYGTAFSDALEFDPLARDEQRAHQALARTAGDITTEEAVEATLRMLGHWRRTNQRKLARCRLHRWLGRQPNLP